MPSSVAVPGASETAQAPVAEDIGVLPTVATTTGDEATSDVPDSTLVEMPVVIAPVDGDVVEETPELLAARDEPDAVAADEVVAERVSSEVVATDEFQTIGVTWPEGADTTGLDPEVRVMTEGEWSAWVELGQGDEAPDPGTPDAENAVRGGTGAMWVGDAEAIQLSFAVSAEGGPDDMTLVLIGSEEVPLPADDSIVGEAEVDADGEMVVQTASMSSIPTAAAGTRVISREEWGARAQVCTPDVASQLVGAVVHHTAGSNTYANQAQAMQQIRNDQRYHIESRGWCDLGYNFVVDKWGNIYEGRARSLSQAVIGVHAGGFNTGTVGVSMLGTYGTPPPAVVQQAVGQIIGLRLGTYGVNPSGSMTYYTGEGENSRYRNQNVALPRVFGHRDVAYTACPGDGGQAALPNIRAIAVQFSSTSRVAQAEALVRAMYADLLGRQPDPQGLSDWSFALLRGTAPAAVAASITQSEEYYRRKITEAYSSVLGRRTDEGGVLSWLAAIGAGAVRIDDIANHLVASEEFYIRSGRNDGGLVRAMYRSLLNRAGSEDEIRYWTSRVPSIGRAGVIASITGSREAAQRKVQINYRLFLGRYPDVGGQSLWTDVLLAQGEAVVRANLVGSEEYRLRAIARYP